MALAGKALHLFLMTAERLLRCRWDGKSQNVEILNAALDGETVRDVERDPVNPNKLYAATLTEIHTSEDGGATWRWVPSGGIDFRDIWAMAVHPTRANEIYVGTLPAAVYVSENGGRSFRELSGFRKLPDYDRWTFPPPPHVAHIRSFALDARVPELRAAAGRDTLLVFTADHGNDPTTPSTDHSREEVPLLVWTGRAGGADLGVRPTFADLGATIADNFELGELGAGSSFLADLPA